MSSTTAKQFEELLLDPTSGICARATSFSELRKLFHSSGANSILLQTLRSTALAAPLSETSTVLSCCHPDIARIRRCISKFSDLKILVFGSVSEEVSRTFLQSSASSSQNASSPMNNTDGKKNSSSSSHMKMVPLRRSREQQESSSSSSPQQQQQQFLHLTSQLTQTQVTFIANVVGLLYGLVFPTSSASQPVACAALVKEKKTIETSEEYSLSNAAERRKALQHSVLCIFSDKGQRFHFSKLWTNLMSEVLFQASLAFADEANKNKTNASSSKTEEETSPILLSPPRQMHIISLHLLTDVNNAIIPWLTNPLLLSDPLTQAYSGGGLLAVLALEGLLTLITAHGLEYPGFYMGLYALVTPDIFSSPHRNRFFRLLDLALSSTRVSAAIAASFIKKLARCALVCPSPALYFVLPFIRQKLQQHSNCFALIHRSLRDVEEEEKEVEKLLQKQKKSGGTNESSSPSSQNNKNQYDRVERLKKLFEGIDPYDWTQPDPEKSFAIDSTLWELSVLERHQLPAVRNAVASFASPAEDNQPLQFERSYARLFAHSMTMTESGSVHCTVVPPPSLSLSSSSSPFAFSGAAEQKDKRSAGGEEERNKFFPL